MLAEKNKMDLAHLQETEEMELDEYDLEALRIEAKVKYEKEREEKIVGIRNRSRAMKQVQAVEEMNEKEKEEEADTALYEQFGSGMQKKMRHDKMKKVANAARKDFKTTMKALKKDKKAKEKRRVVQDVMKHDALLVRKEKAHPTDRNRFCNVDVPLGFREQWAAQCIRRYADEEDLVVNELPHLPTIDHDDLAAKATEKDMSKRKAARQLKIAPNYARSAAAKAAKLARLRKRKGDAPFAVAGGNRGYVEVQPYAHRKKHGSESEYESEYDSDEDEDKPPEERAALQLTKKMDSIMGREKRNLNLKAVRPLSSPPQRTTLELTRVDSPTFAVAVPSFRICQGAQDQRLPEHRNQWLLSDDRRLQDAEYEQGAEGIDAEGDEREEVSGLLIDSIDSLDQVSGLQVQQSI
jgi:hypothetical protein